MAEKNYGNNSQLAEIVKYISDNMKVPVLGAGGGFAPIGTINSYMGTVAPQGWLVCDGTVYNISDYPDLATHIASQFGSTNFFGGDGITTFAVPDTTDITSTTLENGVYIIKATLSDTELDNMHVYSPNEHQVGWWQEEVDGVLKQKPVYEKTIHTGTLNIAKDTDATILDISSYNIDVFITASIRGYESNNIKWAPFGDKGAFSITTDNNIRWRSNTNWAFVDSWLIIQYTKTTDQ